MTTPLPGGNSVLCPYYRSQAGYTVSCSVMDGAIPKHKHFCSKEYKQQFMDRYCRCKFDACKTALSIMKRQLEEESEWMP